MSSRRRCHLRGVPALIAALVIGALLAPGVAHANPLPEGTILIHVQPVAPDFCETNNFDSCSQIVQHTEDTGLLEFDLFAYMPGWGPDVPVSGFDGRIVWSPDWELIDYEVCNDGVGIWTVEGSEAALLAGWGQCPQMNGEVFLIARLIVDVTGNGTLGVEPGVSSIYLYCPPDAAPVEIPIMTPAEAGVVCGYCDIPCDLGSPCAPHLSPDYLELEAVEGGTALTDIDVEVFGGDPYQPCVNVTFSATEDWLIVDVEGIDYDRHVLHVTADAGNLPAGVYEGWVRGEDECVDCTRVVFTVRESQGVPEEDPESPELDPTATSWGRLKSLYR